MVVIEHNLEAIKTADWIIGDPSALGLDPRVGPEGGTQASLRSLRTQDGGGEVASHLNYGLATGGREFAS